MIAFVHVCSKICAAGAVFGARIGHVCHDYDYSQAFGWNCSMPLIRSCAGFATAMLVSTGLTVGCMEASDRGLGPSCQSELEAAEADLKHAKANSIGKAFHWTRAGALIAAARTQQQFSEYENCVIKARNARRILQRNE